MDTVLICRSCASRTAAELALNEKDLANVGMLERHCVSCGTVTKWGLAQDYRRIERRRMERRRGERRAGIDRRQMSRRLSDRRVTH